MKDGFARVVRTSVWLLVLGLGLARPNPAGGQVCSTGTGCGFDPCRTPAVSVPAAAWGRLRPADPAQLPNERDSSNFYDIDTAPSLAYAHWMDLDIENGWIFTAVDLGIEIWDARANPDRPGRLRQVGRSGFPSWTTEPHEGHPVRSIAAPPGDDGVVLVGTGGAGGVVIFNTATKSAPSALYSDLHRSAHQVSAAAIDGRAIGFAASSEAGLLMYDLDAARSLAQPCLDDSPVSTACGVYLGRLGPARAVRYVSGVGDATGGRHWVVVSGGGASFGLEVWDVSEVSAPRRVLAALATEFVHGVALWRDQNGFFLGLRSDPTGSGANPTVGRIYDLSCLPSDACAGLGAPLWTRSLPHLGDDYFVTASESGGIPYLYFGHFDTCSLETPEQSEWLFDVHDPASPLDITPPTVSIDGNPVGYWGWYYRASATGFNAVAPRVGRFAGDRFYRAAYSIFDIHILAPPPNQIFADGFETGDDSRWQVVVP